MKKFKQVFAVIVIALSIISCTNNTGKPKDFDYGRVENNKYLNSFFDVEISLPSGWVVQTKEQTENLTQRGKELIAGDNKKMKAILNASEINTANLLSVFQYEVGSAVEYNPNFSLVAENIKPFPGIKTGADYLFQSRKFLKQSQIQYDSIDDEFKKIVINNQEFYLMNTTISYGGVQIKQGYYSTIRDGFSVNAIISYLTDEQKDNLEKIISSITFKK